MLKIFLLLSLFIFADIAQASDYGCYSHCISRGGSDKACKGKCGDEDSYGEYQEDKNEYRYHNKTGNSNDNHDDDKNNSDEFDNVNMTCFKECRLTGDSFDTCRIMCKR